RWAQKPLGPRGVKTQRSTRCPPDVSGAAPKGGDRDTPLSRERPWRSAAGERGKPSQIPPEGSGPVGIVQLALAWGASDPATGGPGGVPPLGVRPTKAARAKSSTMKGPQGLASESLTETVPDRERALADG